MEMIYQDIPRIYTAVAEWSACLICVFQCKKRYRKKSTIILCLFALMFQILFMESTGDVLKILWLPCMLVAILLMYGFIFTVCHISYMEALFCCINAFLLAEFSASIEWQIHIFLLQRGILEGYLRIALPAFIYTIVSVLYFHIQKEACVKEYTQELTLKELAEAAGIVILTFLYSNLSFVLPDSPFTSSVKAEIFNIRTLADLGGLAILHAFQLRINEYMVQKEISIIQQMLKSQYMQYRNFQDSMEMVHMKYHDIKHQILGLSIEEDVEKRKEWVEQIEEELENSMLFARTGNNVLDYILGAKLLQTRRMKIRITCVAEGGLLNFLHVTDICTIFGNAIDNAIESVASVENQEKRLIHISISRQKAFVFIQISNYCEEDKIIGKNQLPKTTKNDKKNHGYGLKSIRYSVEKYDGSMTVNQKDKWFELKILFPDHH